VKENICENTVFYNNIISTSNNDLLKQLQFAYCTDTEFNNSLRSKDVRNIELSIFHYKKSQQESQRLDPPIAVN